MDLKYAKTYSASTMSFFADDETRWHAVQNRDAVADGFFVYAVKTTKVYCRPICKARLARRANVSFFATGDEAQNAGFRACKRCKPDLAGFMPEERAVLQIRKFVRDQAEGRKNGQKLSLSQMAKSTGLSKWHFHRVFKKCVGVTPFEYLKTQRRAWGDGDSSSPGSDMSWPSLGEQQLGFDGQFDFGFLDDAALTEVSSSASGLQSVGDGGCTPLSFDDLLVWPEDEP